MSSEQGDCLRRTLCFVTSAAAQLSLSNWNKLFRKSNNEFPWTAQQLGRTRLLLALPELVGLGKAWTCFSMPPGTISDLIRKLSNFLRFFLINHTDQPLIDKGFLIRSNWSHEVPSFSSSGTAYIVSISNIFQKYVLVTSD